MLILFISLLVTIAVESAVIWYFLRQEVRLIILFSTIINCLTQPLATYVYWYYLNNLWLVELIVFIVEIFLIKYLFAIKYKQAIVISLVANLLTALLGIVLAQVI